MPTTNEDQAMTLDPSATFIPARQSWYAINKADTAEAEIRIYEEIGAYGITALQLVNELEKITAKKIDVRLNTPGGEVWDGTAIHNALKNHPAKIVVHVDGLAASAGSVIAMAGDEILMADNAYLMIHEARGGVMGEASDMRTYADMLDKINGNIAAMYEQQAGNTKEHWLGLMAAETWFTAEEAKAAGLIDAIETPKDTKAKASFDFRIYNKVPSAVLERWGKNKPTIPANESQRSDPTPEASTKETTMSESTAVAPAKDTAVTDTNDQAKIEEIKALNAQAVEKYRAEGKAQGIREEQERQIARIDAIVAACPGNPQMALSALRSGQTAESVKMAYDAAVAAQTVAQTRIREVEQENLRLSQLLHIGGHPGLNMDLENTAETPAVDPKLQAEKEWDHTPAVRKGFSSKERYVNARVAELSGQLRSNVLARA